jgi:serine/threonine protein kinase
MVVDTNWRPFNSGDMLHGRYRIEQFLGAGGQSVIYRATDCNQSRIVAVKCLRPELVGDFLGQFKSEARIGCELQHDCICAVYDSQCDDTVPYVVMEFVSGVRMDLFIGSQPDGRCSEALFRHLTLQLLDALEYIHMRMYIHRDLRIQNILVTPEYRIKVIDFGIAMPVAQRPSMTSPAKATRYGSRPIADDFEPRLGIAIGAADKLLTSDNKQTSFSFLGPLRGWSLDIHCLGCVLYEMLSGKRLLDIAEDCGARLYPPPSAIPMVGSELNAIVLGCLMQDGVTPLQTAVDIRNALDGVRVVVEALRRWKERCQY